MATDGIVSSALYSVRTAAAAGKVGNVTQKDALLARKSEVCYDAECAARLRAACFMMSEN